MLLKYSYNGILLSQKNNEILAFATTQMKLESTMLKQSKLGRERQIP